MHETLSPPAGGVGFYARGVESDRIHSIRSHHAREGELFAGMGSHELGPRLQRRKILRLPAEGADAPDPDGARRQDFFEARKINPAGREAMVRDERRPFPCSPLEEADETAESANQGCPAFGSFD